MADIISPSGRPISSLGLGSRVTLKGDANSPVMTLIQPIVPQQDGQNMIVGWVCGWFNVLFHETGEAGTISSGHQFNTIQLPVQLIVAAEERVQ